MDAKSPVELVIKAVQSLPDEERETALAWLIDRRPAHWPVPVAGRAVDGGAGTADPPAPLLHRRLEERGVLRGGHQGVLVRLPVDAHTRLREWCARHDFAMATVIRGLVDRFLDQQRA